jgi:hypothetical protein
MAEGGKDRTVVYVVLALVVLWFIASETKSVTNKLSTVGAKNVGYGLGQGLVDSGTSAIGKFFGSFSNAFSSSSSHTTAPSSVGAGNPNLDQIASSGGVEAYDEQPDVVGIAGVDYDVGV